MRFLFAMWIVMIVAGCSEEIQRAPTLADSSPLEDSSPPGDTLTEDAHVSKGDGGAPAASIRLPVRVHLMQSKNVPEIQSQTTDAAVASLFQQVNAIWKQADIQLDVESIVRQTADPALEAVYVAALSSTIQDPTAAQQAYLCAPGQCFYDTDRLLKSGGDKGFNVVIVSSMGKSLGGAFNGKTGAILFSETFGAKVLSHELGHALSLAHVDCSDPCNLMKVSKACTSDGDATKIDGCQVQAARGQAATRSPFPGLAKAPLGCTCGATLAKTTCQGGASTCTD